jgi:hypothetical protein
MLRAGGLLLAVQLSACGDRSVRRPETAQQTEYLAHESLSFSVVPLKLTVFSDDPALGEPQNLLLSGRRLWIIDRAGEPFLHMLDTATGVVLRSMGRKGEGPGEMQDVITGAVADEDSSAVWLYDPRSILLTRFTEHSFSSSAHQDLTTLSLGDQLDNPAQWPYGFGAGRLLIKDNGVRSRFYVVDSKGQVQLEQRYEPPGPDSLPFALRKAVGGTGLCTRHDGSGFAAYYLYAGRIEYYDRNAQRQRTARVPFPSEEVFRPRSTDGELAHVRERYYYTDCAYGGDYLYALFSGKRRAPNEVSIESQFLHVFDRGGRLRQVLHLDQKVGRIAIDRAGSTLYAGSWSGAVVFRARLPRLR